MSWKKRRASGSNLFTKPGSAVLSGRWLAAMKTFLVLKADGYLKRDGGAKSGGGALQPVMGVTGGGVSGERRGGTFFGETGAEVHAVTIGQFPTQHQPSFAG
jgi:hypothetical protein